jgi:hypothetical protein
MPDLVFKRDADCLCVKCVDCKGYNQPIEDDVDCGWCGACDSCREDAYGLLTSIGVPFSPDGEPLGIG